MADSMPRVHDDTVAFGSVLAEALRDAAHGGDAAVRIRLIAEHPEFAREIEEFFGDWIAVDLARAETERPASTLTATPVLCPHCLARVPLALGETVCPGCGTKFRIERPDEALPPLTRIGRYQVQGVAGRGGFGTVYKAWDSDQERTVAIKVPRLGNMLMPEERLRFLNEARVALPLQHPAIVSMFEAAEHDGIPYLVFEFVPGRSLDELLQARRPRPERAARIAVAVAEALAYAHDQNIVHRDIKPSNILLGHDLAPKLADFGLARHLTDNLTITRDGVVLGTVAFMSPEQSEGHPFDGRTDVYSLGVVLYQMLTGLEPFVGSLPMILDQIRHTDPRPPRTINDQLPKDLETICLKCLRKEPERRYATARDLADDLHRFLNHLPVHARPLSRWEKITRWLWQNPGTALATLLALAFLLATTAVSVLWAVHAGAQETKVRVALDDTRRAQAASLLDRGLAECDRGDIADGLHSLCQSLAIVPASDADLDRIVRTNLRAWHDQHPQLTDCRAAPPGAILAVLRDWTRVWVRDPASRTLRPWSRERGAFEPGGVAVSGLATVTPSPDGAALLVVEPLSPNKAELCIVNTATMAAGSKVKVNNLLAAAWCADSTTVVTATMTTESDSSRYDWREAATLAATGRTLEQPGRPEAIIFDPSGTAMVTVLVGGVLRTTSLATGKSEERRLAETIPGPRVSLSADGRWLAAVGRDGVARLIDRGTGRVVVRLRHSGPIVSACFSIDNDHLLTAGTDSLRIWAGLATLGTPTATLPAVLARGAHGLGASAKGNVIAVADAASHRLRIYTVDNGAVNPAKTYEMPNAMMAACSPNGSWVAGAGMLSHGAVLLDAASGVARARLPHPSDVRAVVFNPDSTVAVTVGHDKTACLWSLALPASVGMVDAVRLGQPLVHGDVVRDAAFNREGTVLVTVAADGAVAEWSTDPGTYGERLHSVTQPSAAPLMTVSVNPSDGSYATLAEDGSIGIWIPGTTIPRRMLQHGFGANLLAFRPDGRRLVSAGTDHCARLWDPAAGRLVGRDLMHAKPVTAVAFDIGGRWVLTGSEDRTARFWDDTDARPVGPPLLHGGPVKCTRVLPAFAVTTAQDRVVRFWPLPRTWTAAPGVIADAVVRRTGVGLAAHGGVEVLAAAEWPGVAATR